MGCGRHRILRPLEILGRNGVLTGRAECSFPADHFLKALAPDVLVFQRQSEDSQIEVMKRWRLLLPDAFFVYEIDDALSAVPSYSWHAPYMTPNIDSKLRRAVACCDVVTVTTHDLAEHMRSVCEPGTKIRVVPNMLGRDDMELAGQVRTQLPPSPPGAKLRIGWGGGIGHQGDLAILNEVFSELRDEVEWLFLGMDPVVPPGVHKTFAGAAPPDRYLASLSAINLDLMVAPLEDNLFNRCKSNLRLLEGGACVYPVIASPVAPYLTDSPPVFGYAKNTSEWVSLIRAFAALSPDERAQHGKNMHAWVQRLYVMDDHAEKRVRGWLPDSVQPFKPRLNVKGSGVAIVSDIASLNAALSSSEDILYLRPGAILSDDSKARLLASPLDVVCGLSNDGGPWGFPSQTAFTSLDSAAITGLSKVCLEFSEAAPISLAAVSGPAVLLRRSALAAIGAPDFSDLSLEVSLLEWSCAARARGLKIGLCPSVFTGVSSAYPPSREEAETAALRIQGRWPQGQTDEASLKALRESLEISFHRDFYSALPPAARNDYSLWAAQTDSRGPSLIEAAIEWGHSALRPSLAICQYPATLTDDDESYTAEWVFFAPATAKLPADWRQLILDGIAKNPNALILYADHDHLLPEGKRVNPDFKPSLDLHMLLARDYVSQAVAIRSSELPKDFIVNESSLYSLVLQTIRVYGRQAVKHIPHIAAHIAPLQISDINQHIETKVAAAQAFADSSNWPVKISAHEQIPLLHNISYEPAAKTNALVSIIIPCKNNLEMLAPCVSTVLTMTTYPNFEILIVDNGSTRQEMLDYQASLASDPRVRVLYWPETFNWSALNNFAVEHARGDFFCFLNDDTRVISPNWLSEMVGAASLPNVGAVGARLVYPHGVVQHVGVMASMGFTGHLHKGLAANNPGVNGYAIISHEATAVTGACLVVSREVFQSVGSFDTRLATNFNDVAFCLELLRRGYINVVASRAELQHFEGVTRNPQGVENNALTLIANEGQILQDLYPEHDPYWNPNLAMAWLQGGALIAGMDFSSYIFPALPLPWSTIEKTRIILIGDKRPAIIESIDNAAVFTLTVNGNTASVAHPPMSNTGPWDIRRPEIAAAAFRKLGISKIILTDLGECSLQTLAFIQRLNLPIVYRPIDAEAACPRGDLKPNGSSCNNGYRHNACQSCMDLNSSPHGNVFIPAWRYAWLQLFSDRNTEVDLSMLTNPEYRDALEYSFSGIEDFSLEAAQ